MGEVMCTAKGCTLPTYVDRICSMSIHVSLCCAKNEPRPQASPRLGPLKNDLLTSRTKRRRHINWVGRCLEGSDGWIVENRADVGNYSAEARRFSSVESMSRRWRRRAITADASSRWTEQF